MHVLDLVLNVSNDSLIGTLFLLRKPASKFVVSRRATFKDKLMHIVGDIVECVQSYERGPSDRHTLLIPKQFGNMALSQLVSEKSVVDDDFLTMLSYESNDDIYFSLVHVAFKIRADLEGQTPEEETGLSCNALSIAQDIV